jgi:adenine-specific DNA methylase
MRVYEANVAHIGRLPASLSYAVAEFYFYTTSVIERLNVIAENAAIHQNKKQIFVATLVDMLDRVANAIGPRLVRDLANLAKTQEPDLDK